MNGNNKNIMQQKGQPQALLEAPKKFPMWAGILIAVVATAIVVGGGVYLLQNFLTKPISNTVGDNAMEFNCEQSGGIYKDGECNCSGVEATYEDATGYCITADGSPGGELGEQARDLLKAKMGNRGYVYSNFEYGFSLTFLDSWGNIQVGGPGGVIWDQEDMITLKAENDGDRYVYISVVDIKNKNLPTITDAPITYIGENDIFAFYYAGAGSCAGRPGCEDQKYFDIREEVEEIIKTFEIRDIGYNN